MLAVGGDYPGTLASGCVGGEGHYSGTPLNGHLCITARNSGKATPIITAKISYPKGGCYREVPLYSGTSN